MKNDKIAKVLYALSADTAPNYDGNSFLLDKKAATLNTVYLGFPYLIFAQCVALFASVKLGNKPDTPSRTNTVNRVVKGVRIYDFQK
jgi:tagatose-6-phosphate ketose/aldose isomerase